MRRILIYFWQWNNHFISTRGIVVVTMNSSGTNVFSNTVFIWKISQLMTSTWSMVFESNRFYWSRVLLPNLACTNFFMRKIDENSAPIEFCQHDSSLVLSCENQSFLTLTTQTSTKTDATTTTTRHWRRTHPSKGGSMRPLPAFQRHGCIPGRGSEKGADRREDGKECDQTSQSMIVAFLAACAPFVSGPSSTLRFFLHKFWQPRVNWLRDLVSESLLLNGSQYH